MVKEEQYRRLEEVAKKFIIGYVPLTKEQKDLLKAREEVLIHKKKLLFEINQADKMLDEIQNRLFKIDHNEVN